MEELDNGDAAAVAPIQTTMESTGTGNQSDSPRTIWFRANQKRLEEKEENEKMAKAEIQAKAKEFVKQFAETVTKDRVRVSLTRAEKEDSSIGGKSHSVWQRQKGIEERKKTNRVEEQNTKEATRGPQDGTTWDSVVSLIDFNQGVQQKDTARLRTMLFQAREKNVATSIPEK